MTHFASNPMIHRACAAATLLVLAPFAVVPARRPGTRFNFRLDAGACRI